MNNIFSVPVKKLDQSVFMKLFYESPDAQRIVDKNRRIVSVNNSYAKYYNKKTTHFIGKRCSAFLNSKHCEGINCTIKRMNSEEKVIQYLFNYSGKTKISKHFIVHSIPFKSGKDDETYILEIFKDITDIKNYETVLRESNERYHTLFELANDAMYIVDPETKRFIDVNLQAVKKTGYSKDELLSMTVYDINPYISKDDVDSLIERLKKEGHILFEGFHRLKDGTSISVEINSRLMKYNNRTVWQSIARDISKRKKTENELYNYKNFLEKLVSERTSALQTAKEEAEESNKLKSAFLANISHEIRTPLNGILGFANLLMKDEIQKEQRITYMKIINQSATRLLSMIDNIINMSLIEINRLKIYAVETSIDSILHESYNKYLQMANEKSINLYYKNHSPGNPVIIKTDYIKLGEVLDNLLDNAVKYTHSGSIELGYINRGDHLEFYVEDTGIGIAKEKEGIIFDCFRQSELSNNVDYGGTGLGLALSKAYIEKMGGNIYVNSELGKGSRFWFTLPV